MKIYVGLVHLYRIYQSELVDHDVVVVSTETTLIQAMQDVDAYAAAFAGNNTVRVTTSVIETNTGVPADPCCNEYYRKL